MGTSRAALDVTQYVRINVGEGRMLLQAHRDAVRLAFSDVKPARGNNVYHLLAGDSEPWRLEGVDTTVWALATTEHASLVITEFPGATSAPSRPESGENKSLSTDAWYRPKAVTDLSLLHGVFTYNVPGNRWFEQLDGVELVGAFNHVGSVNGKMNLATGATGERVGLRTWRNPRYEPNRGYLYASSIFLPNPSAAAERSFGMFTDESGTMFRLRSGILYAVRRTTVDGVTSDTETAITLPAGIDLSKGNTFDIQFQWRGVGDYFYYINGQLVHHEQIIGTSDELSIFNPGAPIAFEGVDQGDAAVLQAGCVDVTSEGGSNGNHVYHARGVDTNTGSVAITGYNVPILTIQNLRRVNRPGALINTHDLRLLRGAAYADQRCVFRTWLTRGDAITPNDQAWADLDDGHSQIIVYDDTALTPMAFDPLQAQLLHTARVDQDQTLGIDVIFDSTVDSFITPGSQLTLTMHRETGQAANVGTTIEWSELI